MKRTPMPRPTKRLRARSKRTEKVYRERRPLVAELMADEPGCQFPLGCSELADDPDELLMRSRGGSILDRANIILLCRGHHDWKHANPAEANALGLMPHSWEK